MKHTKFICVVVTLLSAFVATVKAGEWIREQDRFPYALVQEPAAQAGAYMYAGTGLPYYPSGEFAAVPDSLSTIFVNHIGRHGARFLSSSKYTKKVLNYLHRCGPLSPIGRNMLWLCNRIDSITADRWGALDSIGKMSRIPSEPGSIIAIRGSLSAVIAFMGSLHMCHAA